ncbi:MAG: SGNH/GDSL hydrolase family protein [Kiritimatiellia bacterium]
MEINRLAPQALRVGIAALLSAATPFCASGASANDLSMAGFCRRAEQGERLTVAFFGGSLTWGANATDPNRTSWRALVSRELVDRFPQAHFTFVDAAIGGTDSQLGIFRLERDVLAYKPDLLLIEWTCNDDYDAENDNRSCSYEGIIRRYLAACPKGVIAQVIIPTQETVLRDDEATLKRRTERLALGKTYNIATADLLGALRIRHRKEKLDLDAMWPPELGDRIHPFDPGHALYADVVWELLFEQPSGAVATVPPTSVFKDKYRHVVRRRLSEAPQLPDGWRNGYCEVRAGTFDFLCSRWQDGTTIATNNTPLKVKFRGEVLMLFGEATVNSGAIEAWVDGRKIGARKSAWFAKQFAPSAHMVWQVGAAFDGAVEHELEIRPQLEPGEQAKIESICVAGETAATVEWLKP